MYAFQWHFDVPFGKQTEALEILKAWNKELDQAKDIPKAKSGRITVGAIGVSPSHIVDEHVYETLEGYETVMRVIATGRYKHHAEELAKYVVAGSQHWEVLKIV